MILQLITIEIDRKLYKLAAGFQISCHLNKKIYLAKVMCVSGGIICVIYMTIFTNRNHTISFFRKSRKKKIHFRRLVFSFCSYMTVYIKKYVK